MSLHRAARAEPLHRRRGAGCSLSGKVSPFRLPDASPAWHCAEFLQVALRTGLGFLVMGFIGYFVKLVLCVHAAAQFRRAAACLLPRL